MFIAVVTLKATATLKAAVTLKATATLKAVASIEKSVLRMPIPLKTPMRAKR